MHLLWRTVILLGLFSHLVQADDQARRAAIAHIERGTRLMLENRITDSLREFDEAAQADHDVAPHLWQRGICDYYADRFREGRAQFETHKSVNPHDVENAVWHFLCVAKLDGVEKARKALIPIDLAEDRRVPMKEIYQLFAGKGTPFDVFQAAEARRTSEAWMFAHLYVGLYFEATGNAEKAKKHLLEASEIDLDSAIMDDIARVHVRQRKWKGTP